MPYLDSLCVQKFMKNKINCFKNQKYHWSPSTDVLIIAGIAFIASTLGIGGGDGAAVFLIFFFAADPAINFVFAIFARPFVFLMSSVVEFLISLL